MRPFDFKQAPVSAALAAGLKLETSVYSPHFVHINPKRQRVYTNQTIALDVRNIEFRFFEGRTQSQMKTKKRKCCNANENIQE